MIDALSNHLSQAGGWILLLPVVATFLGAVQQRATGFGYGFIAGAGTLVIFNPIVAVVYTGFGNVLLSSIGVVQLRKDIHYPVLIRLIAWMVIGGGVGLFIIGNTVQWMLQALACAVTFWAIWVGTKALLRQQKVQAGEPSKSTESMVQLNAWTSAVPGMLSGALGTSLGIPGPPVIGYLMQLGLTPYSIRATLLALFLTNSIGRLLLMPIFFSMPSFDWVVLSIILLVTLVGSILGGWLGEIIPSGWFGYINILTLSMSGLVLASAVILHFVR